jgi:hypothetical protein
MTTKGNCQIELRENLVWEWVEDKTLSVKHVPNKVNPASIFTKEMKDRAHFWRLWDSFMSCLSNFNTFAVLAVHHVQQLSPTNVIPAVAWAAIESSSSSYFLALVSSSFYHAYTAMSHLSSAGQQLLQNIHGFIPLVLSSASLI